MKKILIVDDVALNIVVVHKMLNGLPFEFHTASNGQQAMDFIRECQPDLMFLDLLMPIVDGFTVLKEVRAGNCGDKDMPIVVLSALNGSPISQAMELGATDYLTKPVMMTRLMKIVENIFPEITDNN